MVLVLLLLLLSSLVPGDYGRALSGTAGQAGRGGSTHAQDQDPSPPIWPEQFTSKFTVRVEQFGPKWSSQGAIYYDWTIKTFRADYFKWCLPLFETPQPYLNYTCSFLATSKDMFFVNHTSSEWNENQCCLFAKGLGAVPPDWLKNDHYRGIYTLRGIECDLWWFNGTSDPNKPCYGYWDARNRTHTPVRFFGLTSIGPTLLDYDTYQVGPPSPKLSVPNEGCYKECQPSVTGVMEKS